MYLKDKNSGDAVEITDMSSLIDPCRDSVKGRLHAGEEMQDEDSFSKADLCFPSNESLPQCWVDPDYRKH